jgi:hypothetical protein
LRFSLVGADGVDWPAAVNPAVLVHKEVVTYTDPAFVQMPLVDIVDGAPAGVCVVQDYVVSPAPAGRRLAEGEVGFGNLQ